MALVKVSVFRLFLSFSTISSQKSADVVVSPLIVLMVDQVRSLRGRDIEAVIISSGSRECSVVDKEFLATEENLRSACFIFTSEALAYSKWRQALENPVVSSRVGSVIIDEAHCVSKWQVLLLHDNEQTIYEDS